jgi:hypothetical protein
MAWQIAWMEREKLSLNSLAKSNNFHNLTKKIEYEVSPHE